MHQMRILALGGCNIRGSLYRAGGQRSRGKNLGWDVVPDYFNVIGPPFRTLTIGEMLQAIDCYRGDRKIPEQLYELCQMTPEVAPTPENSPLESCDVAFLEPNTSIEIAFEGYYVNRGSVVQLTAPLKEIGQEAKGLTYHWFSKGIVAGDDGVKRDAAERLVPLIPADAADRDLLIAVLRGASGSRRDIRQGLRRLVDTLDVPCGVVAYTWAYMADGRPVSWPAGFHGEVVDAAHDLGLPMFEPRPFVQQAGLAFALQEDLRHYTEAFMPVLAGPLVEFARSLAFEGPEVRRYR